MALPPQKSHLPPLLLFISLLLISLFFLHSHPSSTATPSFHRLFLSLSSGANNSISSHLRHLTSSPHVASTPQSSIPLNYLLHHFSLSLPSVLALPLRPLLSFPLSFSLSLSLSLPNLPLIPNPSNTSLIPPYHAFSPSALLLAPALFANLGRRLDYHLLLSLNVSINGSILIIRRSSLPRAFIVSKAAEHGAAGVLLFKEGDHGGVERGTVLLGGIGDPLTPGWAANEDADRLGFDDERVQRRFQKIPSLPISEAVAVEILKRLKGPRMPKEWRGGLPLPEECGVGPGPDSVNFTYQEDRRLATVTNVIGIIKGSEEPDRYVILGNHRDAWTYGAVDPNSGTAALLDIARRYGILLRSGWKPRRTIILCSWDAEEFGMIGSTEWVEQNLGMLSSKAVAYLNVDCAVQGPGFFAGASPQLDNLLVEVTKQIQDPDVEGRTVYDTWVARNGGISIERLARADSDFSAFLHLAGVPSVDLYFGEEFAGYHTSFDNYSWMEKVGDPLFHRHVAMSEIWGLLGLLLADEPLLPFDYNSYVTELQDQIPVLDKVLGGDQSVMPINLSIFELNAAIKEVLREEKDLQKLNIKDDAAFLRTRAFNDRLMLAERGLLDAEGLNGRPCFKHLLYSPPEDSESELSLFPGIADAISVSSKFSVREKQQAIQHEVWRVARGIQRAAETLRGELT